MGNLAQSDWADEPCGGRRGHVPCGRINWNCMCPELPTLRFELETIESEIEILQERKQKILEELSRKPDIQ